MDKKMEENEYETNRNDNKNNKVAIINNTKKN